MTDWAPGASNAALRLRAKLLQAAREFFNVRNVLEVETPLLTSHTVTDVHIESLRVAIAPGAETSFSAPPFYLQTSPEFAMKRLLAAGSGPVFQLCKAFRAGEASRRHNPEFTMLEWYQPGYSLAQLMAEVSALLAQLLGTDTIPQLSYRQCFQQALGVDPHTLDSEQLATLVATHVDLQGDNFNDTDYLQVLMSEVVEPTLPEYCFVYDFPAAQAALAEIVEDETGQAVARRFELYASGMELANGYQECTNAAELQRRFEKDQQRRRELGLAQPEVDDKLLAAIASMPACAGVALGFDRLVMLAAKTDNIADVISFTTDRT